MQPLLRKLGMILICLMLAFVAGCPASTPNTTRSIDTLATITQRGEMNVGYVVFDPCVIKDPATGQLSGFFIDAIEYICHEIKVKPIYHETTLKDFAAGLQTGQYDISIGPTYRTIGRSVSVTFTRPLAYIGNSAIVSRAQASRFRSLADLNNPNVHIAVLQGQAMEAFCRTNLPKAQLVVLGGDQGLTAPLAAVSAQRADVGMSNSVTVYRYAAEHPEVVDVFAKAPLEVVGLCWAVRPNDERLLHFCNNCLDYLDETKRLHQWQSKYSTPLLETVTALQPVHGPVPQRNQREP